MAPTLRDALHVALNRPRVFALAGTTLACEAVVRLAFAAVHPVLAVALPPVVALGVLGAAAPTVRSAVAAPDEPLQWTVGETLRERGPLLVAVAVAGHVVALALGTAAFLLVDTPLRAAVYATGGSVSTTTVHVAPLAGVAAGAFVAWGLLAPTVERAVAGDGVRAAATAPLRALYDRRRTRPALGLYLACALLAAAVFAATLLVPEAYATQEAARLAALATAGGVAVLLVLLGVFVYPAHVALAATRSRQPRPVPFRRVAVAALLVAALVAGASAVRVTETRPGTPGDAATTLPADATSAYAAALDHTAALDHRIVVTERRGPEEVVATAAVERSARQFRASLERDDRTAVGYADSGVTYRLRGYSSDVFSLGSFRVDGDAARALPGYWEATDEYTVTDGVGAGYGLPAPRTGSWTIRAAVNATRTVELTGGEEVFAALHGTRAENVTAETAWVRMRVDAGRGVVLGGRARLNATVDGNRFVRNLSYTVETGAGVDARRPDALGSRSLAEWTWDVFAY
ncbi:MULTISPECIES: hypothetical protein [Halobacterium]|uniref:hypothetical protein n=1 Tax=Halobacterium TaxID=2239 RepID=UPI00073EF534|nr:MULTISPECIES: hypothetical protein [Halobacterium]MCG1003418.1 hypothetical protein [Halobacterium noricense]